MSTTHRQTVRFSTLDVGTKFRFGDSDYIRTSTVYDMDGKVWNACCVDVGNLAGFDDGIRVDIVVEE